MNYQTKEQKLKKYVPIISTTLYFLFRIWEFFVSFKSKNYPANDKRVILLFGITTNYVLMEFPIETI